MGRNPAVGRQGPAHHAAVIPSEDAANALAVKQIRSEIGHPETMRRTLRALGLRHHQQVVRVPKGKHDPRQCAVPGQALRTGDDRRAHQAHPVHADAGAGLHPGPEAGRPWPGLGAG